MMKKRWIRGISALLCLCLCFGGCSKPQQAGSGEENDFHLLPLGSVKAQGWLLDQLTLQKENLTGVYEELSLDAYPGVYDEASQSYIEDPGSDKRISGWISQEGYLGENDFSEERVPYYVRGLVALGYTLDDQELKDQAQKWIDWSIESQVESGLFGPHTDNEAKVYWWSLMLMAQAIEDYYDGVTNDADPDNGDDRVLPFLTKFFEYQRQALKTAPLTEWSAARGGENIEIVKWLYDKTGEDWLLDFCKELYDQSLNWEKVYSQASWGEDTFYTGHGVNMQESMRLMPLMYEITGEESYLDSYWQGVENLYMTSGRIDGLANADEASGDISAVRGAETCAAVERMLSDSVALTCVGDALIGDHLEQVAYNAWPAQLTPELTGQTYFTQQNQVEVSLGVHGFSLDGGERLLYGTPGGYPCCINNCQAGWPKFVSSMWMGTGDNGLAVAAYGPNSVTAQVGDGKEVTVSQETNYPFEETVRLTVNTQQDVSFPLYVRIPSWCENASVQVNGETVEGAEAAEYLKINRNWKNGDMVSLTFPMEIQPVNMQNNSVSVTRGPLVYALAVEEDWAPLKDSFKEQHFSGSYQLPEWDYNLGIWNASDYGAEYASSEIYADSDWNYALQLDQAAFADNFQMEENLEVLDQGGFTFSPENAPVKLTAKGRLVDDWEMDATYAGANAGEVPQSPVATDGPEETLTLIPYAFARLRVALLPWASSSASYEAGAYQPAAHHYGNDRVLFNTVTAEKGFDIRYKLSFTYTAQQAQTLSLWINNEEKGSVSLDAGENLTCTVENAVLDASRYNKVELKTQDGAPLSGVEVTGLRAEKGEELPCTYYWPGDAGVSLDDSTISPNKMQMIPYTDENGEQRNFIASIDDVGDTVTYSNVKAPQDGTYKMSVLYATADPDEEHTYTHTVLVNGENQGRGKIKYPFNCLWNQFSYGTYAVYYVDLKAGDNTIQLKKTDAMDGYVQIAAMVLSDTPVAQAGGETAAE